jgi:hypothetical protein
VLLLRVLLKALQTDRFQIDGDERSRLGGVGSSLSTLMTVAMGGSAEGRPACQQLIENHAECVNVGRRPHIARSLGLLAM